VSRLVVVVPLKAGSRGRAEELLEQGPPFDIDKTRLNRHDVFLTEHEVVFDFETPGTETPLELRAEDPFSHQAASAWGEIMADKPRKALLAFSWTRDA
jgi:hypothetical protein